MELEAGKIAELHHEIKKKRPVIHCITNAIIVPPQVLIKNGTTKVNNAAAVFPITR